MNPQYNSPPLDTQPKSTKRNRKLDDPPRKKRRTTSASASPAREPWTHGGKSHDILYGDGSKPLFTANEEEDEPTKGQYHAYDEEERILEEALSEGYHSAGMNDESWNNDFEVDSRNGKLDDETQQDEQKAQTPQEEEEDSDEVEVLKLSATRHLPQAKEDSSSEVEVLKMAPRQPRPPTQPNRGAESGHLITKKKKISLQEVFARAESQRRMMLEISEWRSD
jgi:hypothetical protein